jgi:hypothetical protein
MLALVGRTVERAIGELNPLRLDAAVKLLNRVVSDTLHRISRMVENSASGEGDAARIQMDFLVDRSERCIESIQPFLEEEEPGEFEQQSAAAAAKLRRTAREICQIWMPASHDHDSVEMLGRVPRRTFCGPLYRTELLRLFSAEERGWWESWAATIPAFPLFFDLLIFHCDGRHTLKEILNIIALSGKRVPHQGAEQALELLARHGLLEFVGRER